MVRFSFAACLVARVGTTLRQKRDHGPWEERPPSALPRRHESSWHKPQPPLAPNVHHGQFPRVRFQNNIADRSRLAPAACSIHGFVASTRGRRRCSSGSFVARRKHASTRIDATGDPVCSRLPVAPGAVGSRAPRCRPLASNSARRRHQLAFGGIVCPLHVPCGRRLSTHANRACHFAWVPDTGGGGVGATIAPTSPGRGSWGLGLS